MKKSIKKIVSMIMLFIIISSLFTGSVNAEIPFDDADLFIVDEYEWHIQVHNPETDSWLWVANNIIGYKYDR